MSGPETAAQGGSGKPRSAAKPGLPALSVSIVTYAPDLALLQKTLASLRRSAEVALARARISSVGLVLVDNGPGQKWHDPLAALLASTWTGPGCGPWRLLAPGRNLGFGLGHNHAMESSTGEYHLVLNPDVLLAEDAITEAAAYLETHPEVGLVSPLARGETGERQYLCKAYPAAADLLLRGFGPAWLRSLFRRRLDAYELRGMTEGASVEGIRIASGAFMFCRRSLLDAIGGFTNRFFLYFEDFDLSLRASRQAEIAYVPAVQIVHHGGSAAKKGLRHLWLFMRSALTFYRLHGWKWL